MHFSLDTQQYSCTAGREITSEFALTLDSIEVCLSLGNLLVAWNIGLHPIIYRAKTICRDGEALMSLRRVDRRSIFNF